MRSDCPTRIRGRRLLVRPLLVAALMAVSVSCAHAQDDKRVSREREALRRSQQALRAAQEQQAGLQREKDKLAGDLAKARADLTEGERLSGAVKAQLQTSRAGAERLRADLARDQAALEALKQSTSEDRQKLEARLEASEARLAETRRDLAERTAANTAVSALLERSVAALEKAEAANRQLYGIANELLDAYRHKGVGESLAQRDPFFGLKDVEIENRAEEFRSRMAGSRIAAPKPPQP